ncbi:MAG: type III-A CRISPR-associated RAMP protein Csm4 [Caldisericaceae bacterium]
MATYIYKLRFDSPLLVSSDPFYLEKPEIMIHSDTLFSAIINTLSYINGGLSESFTGKPPFILSSAFPYYNDTLFFKKPRISIISEELGDLSKKLKKAQFVSEDVFKKIVKGERIEIDNLSFNEEFLSSSKIQGEMFALSEVPRCKIDRLTTATDIFYSNRLVFSPDSGLFFLTDFKEQTYKSQFDSAVNLLGESGIGGERSLGFGRFKVMNVKEFKVPLEEQQSQSYFTNLSLYHPQKAEVDSGLLERARYDIIERQNWIYSGGPTPLRSKSVRMFSEGGVFSYVKGVEGDLVDTTPQIADKLNYLNHRVYRSGLLFRYPVALKD